MNPILFVAAGIALLAPTASSSQSQDPEITVQGIPLTPARWAASVSRKLDAALVYPRAMLNQSPDSGIVSVRFRANAANRPDELTLSRKSGSRALDRAAMSAIAGIGTMPAMPSSFRPDQQFVANILFATDLRQHEQQLALLRKEAIRLRAARTAGADPVAMVITSHAGGVS